MAELLDFAELLDSAELLDFAELLNSAELLDNFSELWGGTVSEDCGSAPLDAGVDEEVAEDCSMELEDLDVFPEEDPLPSELLGFWTPELTGVWASELAGVWTSSAYSHPLKALSNSS